MKLTDHIRTLALGFLHHAIPLTPTDEEFRSWVTNQPLPARFLFDQANPGKYWAGGRLLFTLRASVALTAWCLRRRSRVASAV